MVVVTWHSRDLNGLQPFPLGVGAKFALMIKGNLKRCERDIPDWLEPHVVLCETLENSSGRDSHTIAHFVWKHYYTLPFLTFFVQDDDVPRGELDRIPREPGAAFDAWLSRSEEDPFVDSHSCLCNVVTEPWVSPDEFGEGGYGGMYPTMKYLMEMYLDYNVTSLPAIVRWPGADTFTVSARAVRRHSRAVYALFAELLRDGEGDRHLVKLCAGNACRGPGDTGHIFERLWFAIFDASYAHRLI